MVSGENILRMYERMENCYFRQDFLVDHCRITHACVYALAYGQYGKKRFNSLTCNIARMVCQGLGKKFASTWSLMIAVQVKDLTA